jgi:hypothetical protein
MKALLTLVFLFVASLLARAAPGLEETFARLGRLILGLPRFLGQ